MVSLTVFLAVRAVKSVGFGAVSVQVIMSTLFWTLDYSSVLIYSTISPGWQSRTSQILSSTSTGKCLMVPVQIAEMVGGRMPVYSASSFWVISRIASITLTLNLIIGNHSPFTALYHGLRNKSIRTAENIFVFRIPNYVKRIDKLRSA